MSAAAAVDAAGNTQPESPAGIYNVRGVLNNSWHRILVNAPVLYQRRAEEDKARVSRQAVEASQSGSKARL